MAKFSHSAPIVNKRFTDFSTKIIPLKMSKLHEAF